jgi:hypothetical protein
MANPAPGYKGKLNIDDIDVRCTSFGVNPTQTALFYDHVIGLRDTIPTDDSTKGVIDEASTDTNIQKRIWRPSVRSIAGGLSFPATENSLNKFFELGRYAQYFDFSFLYYCGSEDNTREFEDCRVNNFDFSVNAGDIVQISVDVMGKKVTTTTSYSNYITPEKLITWDQCGVTVNNAPFSVTPNLIQGVNFKINNNVQPIYVAGTPSINDDSLNPYDLRVGMQEVTGNLIIYLEAGQEFIPISLTTPATITISIPGSNIEITAVFQTNSMEGVVGPVSTSLPFVGVDRYFL